MMIKLFHIPETNAIVAKSNNVFYSLPTLKVIDKPAVLIPCKALCENVNTSQWCFVPDGITPLVGMYAQDGYIKIHKVILTADTKTSHIRLSGRLPIYVLDGLTNLLIQEA